MKKFIYSIIIICFFVLFNNCNKSEEPEIKPDIEPIVDLYFTDLNDTTVFSHWACYESYYYLDIDKDSIDDVKIKTFSSYSTTGGSEAYIEVFPIHGYEIAFGECITTSWSWNPEIDTIFHIDTVLIPDIFHIGNTLLIEGNYTSVPVMLSYGYSPTGPGSEYSSGLHYSIYPNTNFYLAFRKINGINNKLAWLKVKSYGSYIITLNSCRYMENETFLIVE